MFLSELYSPPIAGYQDVSDDNSIPTFKSSRKTKLTLRQIRKLRRMMDLRGYETQQHLKRVRKQYGAKSDTEGSPSV